jgi:hypothetical protein
MNLRAEFQGLGLNYPLSPLSSSFTAFVTAGELPASAGRYLELDAGAGAPDLRLRLTGENGAPFASGELPALSVLRIQ